MSSELKLRSIWKTQKILASPFWAFFVGPFLYKPIYKSFLLGQGKIYSYSEQAESINKDCCNSQTSPGGHSQNQLSAKDLLFLYLCTCPFYIFLFCVCISTWPLYWRCRVYKLKFCLFACQLSVIALAFRQEYTDIHQDPNPLSAKDLSKTRFDWFFLSLCQSFDS